MPQVFLINVGVSLVINLNEFLIFLFVMFTVLAANNNEMVDLGFQLRILHK